MKRGFFFVSRATGFFLLLAAISLAFSLHVNEGSSDEKSVEETEDSFIIISIGRGEKKDIVGSLVLIFLPAEFQQLASGQSCQAS